MLCDLLPIRLLNSLLWDLLWIYGSWGHGFLYVWQSRFARGQILNGLASFFLLSQNSLRNSLLTLSRSSHSINNPTAIHILQSQVPGLKLWLLSGFAGPAKGKFPASPTAYNILPTWTLCFRVLLQCLQDRLHYFFPRNAISFTQ